MLEAIEEQNWFTSDWDSNVTGTMMKIYKRNWKNEKGMGVHYEFWLGKSELQNKIIRLYFHIENDVGDRDEFAKELKKVSNKELVKLRKTDRTMNVKEGAPTFLTTTISLDEETLIENAVEKLN